MKLYRNLSEAVVEGLNAIFLQNKYADKVIEKVLKSNPRWGARDRRFIAETIYDIVRWYRLFQYITQADETDFWKMLGAWCVVNDIQLPPWSELQSLKIDIIQQRLQAVQHNRKIRESITDWLDELGNNELGNSWETELKALNTEAKVVLRANTLKVTVGQLKELLKEENIETLTDANYSDALILEKRQNIFGSMHFKNGLFEVQDAGSQAIAPFLQAEAGMRVIDACAGGGGKTLHLAALMNNRGRIIAMDTEAWKLEELKKRARRAGAGNIETRVIESSKTIKRLENSADRLLLDVPCSGMGVLKRNPDAKWKLSLDFINRVKEIQKQILESYSNMLKPGGYMVYSTCSLLPSENEKQVEIFLNNNKQFELINQKTILPSASYDGFFMALLKRKDAMQ